MAERAETASKQPPAPKIERAWHYRLFCPECRFTRDFIRTEERRLAESAYRIHYMELHDKRQ